MIGIIDAAPPTGILEFYTAWCGPNQPLADDAKSVCCSIDEALLCALIEADRLAEFVPPRTELHAQANRIRGKLLSLAVTRLPPAALFLAVERDGVRHRVIATFPQRGNARVSLWLDALDWSARLRVAETVGR